MKEYSYYLNEEQIRESHERLKKAYRMEQVDHIPIVQVTRKDLPYTIFDKVYDEKVIRLKDRKVELKNECINNESF